MDTENLKILVIDDKQDNLTAMEVIVEGIFPAARVLTALNGQAGIELASAEDPDVILLDIIMPEMDGYRVCRKLKEDENLRHIPVVFLTGQKTDRQSRIRALEVGAEAFLSKPVAAEELLAQIWAMTRIKMMNRSQRQEKEQLAALVAERTRQLERELGERFKSEAALKKAQTVAHIGSWTWYIPSNRLEWSDQMYQIFGIDKNDFTGNLADVMALAVHPDDRAAVERANLSVINDKTPMPLESRVIWPDGTVHVVWAETGDLILDEAGNPAILTGIAQDITERKQAEDALRRSEAHYRALVEGMPGVVYSFSRQRGGVYYSPHVMDLLGYSQEQLYAQPLLWNNSIHPDDRPRIEQAIREAATGKPFRVEYRIRDALGNWHWFHDRSLGYHTDGMDGIIEGLALDITERKQAEEGRANYMAQILRLGEATLLVNTANSLPKVVSLAVSNARLIAGVNQAALSFTRDKSGVQVIQEVSFADKFAHDPAWCDFYRAQNNCGGGSYLQVCRNNQPVLKTKQDLETDPDVLNLLPTGRGQLSINGWLAVPLTNYAEENIGVVQLSDKVEGNFTENDVAVMLQYARMISIAIEKARLMEQLKQTHEQMRRLAQQVISVQETERRNLSRELHDDAGQSLAALKISLQLIEDDIPQTMAPVRERVKEMVQLTDVIIDKTRRISHLLRPPGLDTIGLNASLEGLCLDFARHTQIDIHYEGTAAGRLDDALNITLYRFLQEALTNAARHAHAKCMRVTLKYDVRSITLTVEDDGGGFSPEALTQAHNIRGVGLSGMRERLEVLKGRLTIESKENRGTTLTAQIPLDPPSIQGGGLA